MIRSLLAVVIFSLLALPGFAGQLTVAVVSYSDERDPDTIAAALAGQNLAKLTNGARIDSGPGELKHGIVRFTQTTAASPGTVLDQDTRIMGTRAISRIRLTGSTVEAEITTEEDVKLGLSKTVRYSYSGSGEYRPGAISVIGFRQSSSRQPVITKNSKTVKVTSYTTLILAQYLD